MKALVTLEMWHLRLLCWGCFAEAGSRAGGQTWRRLLLPVQTAQDRARTGIKQLKGYNKAIKNKKFKGRTVSTITPQGLTSTWLTVGLILQPGRSFWSTLMLQLLTPMFLTSPCIHPALAGPLSLTGKSTT